MAAQCVCKQQQWCACLQANAFWCMAATACLGGQQARAARCFVPATQHCHHQAQLCPNESTCCQLDSKPPHICAMFTWSVDITRDHYSFRRSMLQPVQQAATAHLSACLKSCAACCKTLSSTYAAARLARTLTSWRRSISTGCTPTACVQLLAGAADAEALYAGV